MLPARSFREEVDCSVRVEGGLPMLGLYWDNGKENGHYYSILGFYWCYIGGSR